MRSGNAPLAAELYAQAYKLAPGRHALLFKAAVAEQMAENWQGALDLYDRYLAVAPADAEDRAQALTRDGQMREKLGKNPLPVATSPVVVQSKPAESPPTPPPPMDPVEHVQRPAPLPMGSRWPGWTGVATGGALVVVAAALLVTAQVDAAQLSQDQSHAPGALITTISREEALSRASAINTRAALGWTAAGLGAAAGAFGAWWLTTHPAETAVVLPTPQGATLLVNF